MSNCGNCRKLDDKDECPLYVAPGVRFPYAVTWCRHWESLLIVITKYGNDDISIHVEQGGEAVLRGMDSDRERKSRQRAILEVAREMGFELSQSNEIQTEEKEIPDEERHGIVRANGAILVGDLMLNNTVKIRYFPLSKELGIVNGRKVSIFTPWIDEWWTKVALFLSHEVENGLVMDRRYKDDHSVFVEMSLDDCESKVRRCF